MNRSSISLLALTGCIAVMVCSCNRPPDAPAPPPVPPKQNSAPALVLSNTDLTAFNVIYGSPVKTDTRGIYKPGESHVIHYTYFSKGLQLELAKIVDGQDRGQAFVSLIYSKKDRSDVTPEEAPALLNSLADGHAWVASNTEKPPTRWQRADGTFMAWLQRGTLRVSPASLPVLSVKGIAPVASAAPVAHGQPTAAGVPAPHASGTVPAPPHVSAAPVAAPSLKPAS